MTETFIKRFVSFQTVMLQMIKYIILPMIFTLPLSQKKYLYTPLFLTIIFIPNHTQLTIQTSIFLHALYFTVTIPLLPTTTYSATILSTIHNTDYLPASLSTANVTSRKHTKLIQNLRPIISLHWISQCRHKQL